MDNAKELTNQDVLRDDIIPERLDNLPIENEQPVTEEYSSSAPEVPEPEENSASAPEVPEPEENSSSAPEVPEPEENSSSAPEVPEPEENSSSAPEVPEPEKDSPSAPEEPETEKDSASGKKEVSEAERAGTKAFVIRVIAVVAAVLGVILLISGIVLHRLDGESRKTREKAQMPEEYIDEFFSDENFEPQIEDYIEPEA